MDNTISVSRKKPLAVEAAGNKFSVLFLCSGPGCSDERRAILPKGRVELPCRCGYVNKLKVCLGGYTMLELGGVGLGAKVFAANPEHVEPEKVAGWPMGEVVSQAPLSDVEIKALAVQMARAAHAVRIHATFGEAVDDAKVKQVVTSGFIGFGANLTVRPPGSDREATLDELVAMLGEKSSLRAEIERLRDDLDTAWALVAMREEQLDEAELVAGMSVSEAFSKLRDCVSDRAGLAFAIFAVAMEDEAKRRADGHPIPWVLGRMMVDPTYATQFKTALDQASAIMKQAALHGSDGIRAYFEAARAKVTAMAAASRAKAVMP
jgi:hypothetical protein